MHVYRELEIEFRAGSRGIKVVVTQLLKSYSKLEIGFGWAAIKNYKDEPGRIGGREVEPWDRSTKTWS